MSAPLASRITPQQYLAIERTSEARNEFHDGEIFAMGGASERHNTIVFNIGGELRLQLKGKPCRAYLSDMRVKVTKTGLYTYPDVVAVCDQPQFDDEMRDTLLNPRLIAEVLSKSTESYDRGKKFEHYRKLDSLKEYVLIAQDQPCVEHYSRQDDHRWLLTEVSGLDANVELPAIGCRLALAEVYDKVDFSSEAAGPAGT